QLLRLPRWMQRVAECYDATDAELVGVIARCEMGRDTAAHRLAADEHAGAAEMKPGRGDGGAVTRVEFFRAIRNAAPPLCIKKIERQDVHAAVGQASREIGDECALLSRARAMREDEGRVRRRVASRIHEASSLSIGTNVNRQRRRHTCLAHPARTMVTAEEGIMFLVRDI